MTTIKWRKDDKVASRPEPETATAPVDLEPKLELAIEIAAALDGQLLALMHDKTAGDEVQTALICKHRIDPEKVARDPKLNYKDLLAVIAVDIPKDALKVADLPEDAREFSSALEALAVYGERVPAVSRKMFRAAMIWSDARPLMGAFPALDDPSKLISLYDPPQVRNASVATTRDLMAFALCTHAWAHYIELREHRPDEHANPESMDKFARMMSVRMRAEGMVPLRD